MAKKKSQSVHSRAARRATSPDLNTDKSLKDVVPPKRSATRPSVLAVHSSAGVSKKAKHGRKSVLSAKAKRRQEKSLEMAEAILERTSKKIQRSAGHEKTIKERSKAWESINKIVEGEIRDVREAHAGDDGEEEEAAEGWETDEEMKGADETTLTASAPLLVPEVVAPGEEATVAQTSLLPVDVDDEIL
ncbi:hypothetical protein G7046_g4682 [Stylonectria norvegica]|nr:hypothetical protein G7046_g4682 [Stylonectria norvegica]